MKKLNKGFTLIELLAVIVILAIILLIAVPMIANVVEDVKKGAFISSVSMIVKSAEYENINEANSDIDLATLNYSGKRYETGSMSKNTSGQIEAYIWNDELQLCAVKRYESKEVLINPLFDENTCSNNAPTVAIDLDSNDPTYPCYTFDSGTGAITGYDIDNPVCPANFYSPTSIDGVNVLLIGNGSDSIAPGKLTTIDLNDAAYLEKIENKAFYYPYNVYVDSLLTSVVFPDSSTLKYIGDLSFQSNSNLESLNISEGVTHIGSFSFDGCGLTSISLPSSLTNISNYAFYKNKLTSLSIPNGVTTIGDYAFNQNKLTSLTIPNGVTTIGNNAFAENLLTSLSLPSSLNSLGYGIFSDNLLTEVIFEDGTTTIGESMFRSNKLTSINIPTSVTSIGSTAFNDNQLSEDSAFIYARNASGTIDTSKLIGYGGANRENVIIPNNVLTIGNYAFYSSDLVNVTIPSSVTSIGKWAFAYNDLTSITIPNSVTSIWERAFQYNELTTIVFGGSNTTLGQEIVYYRDYLRDAYVVGGAGTYTGTQDGVWTKN